MNANQIKPLDAQAALIQQKMNVRVLSLEKAVQVTGPGVGAGILIDEAKKIEMYLLEVLLEGEKLQADADAQASKPVILRAPQNYNPR